MQRSISWLLCKGDWSDSRAAGAGQKPSQGAASLLKGRGNPARGAQNSSHAGRRIFLQRALPNSNDAPAGFAQRSRHPLVALLIGQQLAPPEGAVVFRLCGVPGTPMPETTVHENRRARSAKNKIRPNRKPPPAAFPLPPLHSAFCILHFKFILPSAFPDFQVPPPALDAMLAQQSCQRQLRLLVAAAANPRHHFGALRLGENISHFFSTTV